jgi:predicted ATPase
MSLLKRNLNQVWEQLRSKKALMSEFLDSVQIKNLRGIEDLRVTFNYPVSVIAGSNGCGKSTVLFACACAYDVNGRRDFFPTTLFPNLKTTNFQDDPSGRPSFEYTYKSNGAPTAMRWGRGKSWSRSFLGRKDATQPKREIALRTLANLTSPSEVRSILQINNKDFAPHQVSADLIAFAHSVLPFKYQDLQVLQLKNKDLLFATRKDTEAQYSEFHMSAGERALLRISKDISNLNNALILIDEIEAGLHPFTQQQVMLELQRLALRNNLQIIVTSHSPVVLESVPVEGRIFLERTQNNVTLLPPYRDIFQKALYGSSINKLSILCEDSVAENLILGVLDHVNVGLNLSPDDITVGRDTGKDSFPQHVSTLGKFQLLPSFVFVLDGDAKSLENKIKLAGEEFGQVVKPLFLPSDDCPEDWVYRSLENDVAYYTSELAAPNLDAALKSIRQTYENASDKPSSIAKNRFRTLCDTLQRTQEGVARIVGRKEATRSEMKVFANELVTAVYDWRRRSGNE